MEASARLFASDVRGAVLEGAGHWPTDENPDGLVRLLLDFLGPGQAAAASVAPDGAVEAAARRALEAWEHGEHTGDHGAFRALLSPDFRLFSHPVWRRGVHRGPDARAAMEALVASRERAPNGLTFSDVRAARDGDTVVLRFHSAGAIGGRTRFDGQNAIALLMQDGLVAGFQEFFGDIPPEWPR